MTTLWDVAGHDYDAEAAERRLAMARVACAQFWPFLAAAESPGEYGQRETVAAERIDATVAGVVGLDDADAYVALREAVVASLRADYEEHHREVVAPRLARRAEAEARERVVAEHARRVAARTAGYVPPEWGENVPEDFKAGHRAGWTRAQQAGPDGAPGEAPSGSSEPFARGWQEGVAQYARKKTSMRKGAPFAGYEDFDACVRANQDKDDPEAYCGKIKHQVEDGKTSAKENPYGTCPKCGSGKYRKDLGACTQCGYKKTGAVGGGGLHCNECDYRTSDEWRREGDSCPRCGAYGQKPGGSPEGYQGHLVRDAARTTSATCAAGCEGVVSGDEPLVETEEGLAHQACMEAWPHVPLRTAAEVDHWGSDDEHTVEEWQQEVAEGDTRLGYKEWVANKREMGKESSAKTAEENREDSHAELGAWPSAEKSIDAIREIVASKSAKVIDGVFVDMQSANAIVAAYDALSPENQQRFVAMPIDKMGAVAWQLVGRTGSRRPFAREAAPAYTDPVVCKHCGSADVWSVRPEFADPDAIHFKCSQCGLGSRYEFSEHPALEVFRGTANHRTAEYDYRSGQAPDVYVCPYCDFTGDAEEQEAHLRAKGPQHKDRGTVTDQLNAQGAATWRRQEQTGKCTVCGAPGHVYLRSDGQGREVTCARHKPGGSGGFFGTKTARLEPGDEIAFEGERWVVVNEQEESGLLGGEQVALASPDSAPDYGTGIWRSREEVEAKATDVTKAPWRQGSLDARFAALVTGWLDYDSVKRLVAEYDGKPVSIRYDNDFGLQTASGLLEDLGATVVVHGGRGAGVTVPKVHILGVELRADESSPPAGDGGSTEPVGNWLAPLLLTGPSGTFARHASRAGEDHGEPCGRFTATIQNPALCGCTWSWVAHHQKDAASEYDEIAEVMNRKPEEGVNNAGQPATQPCGKCGAEAEFVGLMNSWPAGTAAWYRCPACGQETAYKPVKAQASKTAAGKPYPDEPEAAWGEACDHYEEDPGTPNLCKRCGWAYGAHDRKAGGPSGVGEMPGREGAKTATNPYLPNANPYTTSGPGTQTGTDPKPSPNTGDESATVPDVEVATEPLTTRPRVRPSGGPGAPAGMTGPATDDGGSVTPAQDSPAHARQGFAVLDPKTSRVRSTHSRLADAEGALEGDLIVLRASALPEAALRREAKVAEIVAGVLATNPGMDQATARAVAERTLDRFPQVVAATGAE